MELGLLILESVLLIFTVVLLIFSLKEGRGRDRLLVEVSRATKTLNRHSYFVAVQEVMMDTGKELFGIITGRRPFKEDISMTKAIVADIEKLTSQGVSIRYLLPRFPDRLYIAHLYVQAGAKVRMGGCSAINDLRYIVSDGKLTVLGIPEKIGEKEATQKGFRIPSEDLAHTLRRDFDDCWESAISFEDYVSDVVSHTGATLRALAQEVGLTEEELKKVTDIKK
jgi:hypothetical protein